MIKSPHWLGTGILAGTIIGAGVFSLPYIFQSSGLGLGFFYLAIGAAVYSIIYLMYGDVIVRTAGRHDFVGLARIYLGREAAWFSVLMTVVQAIFVLTIYLILSQSFANLITPLGAPLEKLIIFWLVGSATIYLTLKRFAWFEFLVTGGIILIIGLIFILGLKDLSQIAVADFLPKAGNIFLPLAPILFSLAGRAAVLGVVEVVGRENHSAVRRSLIWGTVIPPIVYAFFVLAVVAISGTASEDAVSGLIGQLPSWALLAMGVLGIFSLITSYAAIGTNVKKILDYDLRVSAWLRFVIVILGPILFYFAGLRDFIALVSFVGGIFLAIEAFLIIAMWRRAKKITEASAALLPKIKPSLLILTILVFTTALIYEILK